MFKQIEACAKPYFHAAMASYLVAIVITVIVMMVFDHGQPALLYLVPANLLSVIFTALMRGEKQAVMDYNEENVDEDSKKSD
jgi:minor histocompatibility antigen H13